METSSEKGGLRRPCFWGGGIKVGQISTLGIIFVNLWKKIVLGYFHYLQMIEYFRLNIEYLRNSFHY